MFFWVDSVFVFWGLGWEVDQVAAKNTTLGMSLSVEHALVIIVK